MRYEFFPLKKHGEGFLIFNRRRGNFGPWHADKISGFTTPEAGDADTDEADVIGQLIKVEAGNVNQKYQTFALPNGQEIVA